MNFIEWYKNANITNETGEALAEMAWRAGQTHIIKIIIEELKKSDDLYNNVDKMIERILES